MGLGIAVIHRVLSGHSDISIMTDALCLLDERSCASEVRLRIFRGHFGSLTVLKKEFAVLLDAKLHISVINYEFSI
jgi:hypothetical protein